MRWRDYSTYVLGYCSAIIEMLSMSLVLQTENAQNVDVELPTL
jgi:hypothetical protein